MGRCDVVSIATTANDIGLVQDVFATKFPFQHQSLHSILFVHQCLISTLLHPITAWQVFIYIVNDMVDSSIRMHILTSQIQAIGRSPSSALAGIAKVSGSLLLDGPDYLLL